MCIFGSFAEVGFFLDLIHDSSSVKFQLVQSLLVLFADALVSDVQSDYILT